MELLYICIHGEFLRVIAPTRGSFVRVSPAHRERFHFPAPATSKRAWVSPPEQARPSSAPHRRIPFGMQWDDWLRSLGEQLMFPAEFVGRGDMSRGGLTLRRVQSGEPLTYVPLLGATRHGPKPPKLAPLPRKLTSSVAGTISANEISHVALSTFAYVNAGVFRQPFSTTCVDLLPLSCHPASPAVVAPSLASGPFIHDDRRVRRTAPSHQPHWQCIFGQSGTA